METLFNPSAIFKATVCSSDALIGTWAGTQFKITLKHTADADIVLLIL